MDPYKKQGTVVYKFFVDKQGGRDSEVFVGDEGQIFYDPTLGDLRISNDETPGGIPLLQVLMNAPTGNTIVNLGNTTPEPLPGANTVVYNNTVFESMGVINYGDVKHGFQQDDHFGWVMLNGRNVSTLSADQQAIATQLGWGAGIPNMVGYLPKMSGETPGTTGGLANNRYNVSQSELPNVTLFGNTSEYAYSTEDHAGATLGLSGDWLRTGGADLNFGGTGVAAHSHIAAVDLNPISQIQTNVENQYMALNAFVYLGL